MVDGGRSVLADKAFALSFLFGCLLFDLFGCSFQYFVPYFVLSCVSLICELKKGRP